MAASLERQLWKQLTKPKYVGWAGLATVCGLLLGAQFGSAVAVAAADVCFCLIKAPTVCGAATVGARPTPCRHNGRGLLRGCAAVQQHTEQRLVHLRNRNLAEVRAHLKRNITTTALLALSALALVISIIGWIVQRL